MTEVEKMEKAMNTTARRLTRSTTTAALALLTLCLLAPARAAAQWTQPDAQGHINTTNSGNVGVGTSSPSARLDVRGGSIQVSNTDSGSVSFRDGDGTLRRHAFWMMSTDANGGVLAGVTNFLAPTSSAPSPDALYFVAPYANNWDKWYPTLTLKGVSAAGAGNVGVGTTGPTHRLHVAGDNTAAGGYPALKLENTQAGGHSWWLYSGAWGVPGALGFYDETAGSYRLFLDPAGRLGVGTTDPLGGLHLNVGAAAPGYKTYTASASHQGLVLEAVQDTSAPYRRVTNVAALGNQDGTSGGSELAFQTNPKGGFTSAVRMVIKEDGNVGVGTQSPAAKLDVNAGSDAAVAIKAKGGIEATGTIRADNIEARFQDVAEWVPSKQKLQAGTVVVLDTENSNHVVASTSAYDTRVAGVVSARPGIALGEAGEGKALVATTGRVKVRVDATRGAIRIGDLIVTGEAEGVGMRSEPVSIGGRQFHAPGTIIGKALEPLEKGVGEILVLLSLQ